MSAVCCSMANDKPERTEPAPNTDSPRRTTVSTPTRTIDGKNDKGGLIVGIATLAIDVTDRSTTTAIGLANDARGELRSVADTSIDAIENVVRGIFRLSKRATARFDEL